jgi:hypothetical protein
MCVSDLPPPGHARKRFSSGGGAHVDAIKWSEIRTVLDLCSTSLWVINMKIPLSKLVTFSKKKSYFNFFTVWEKFLVSRVWATPRCNFISALELFFFQVGLVHSHTAVDCRVGIVVGLLDWFLMSWLGGLLWGFQSCYNYKFQIFHNLLWFSNVSHVTCYNL